MVLLAEQMRLINTIFSTKFKEDEFRLSEQLTRNRVYTRINKMSNAKLLDIYYIIIVNYKERFTNINNKYMYTIYQVLLDILKERNVDTVKYYAKKKRKKRTIDYLSALLGVVVVVAFRNAYYVSYFCLILTFLSAVFWKKAVFAISKILNVDGIRIYEYKTVAIIFFISNTIVTILNFRTSNSLLFLILASTFMLTCHIYSMSMFKKVIKKKKYNKKQRIRCYCYEYGLLAIILFFMAAPILDTFAFWIGTKDARYFEGICEDVKNRTFGFAKAKINGIDVIVFQSGRNVEVGNYYKVTYGNHTKAVTKIEEIDIKDKVNDFYTNISKNVSKFQVKEEVKSFARDRGKPKLSKDFISSILEFDLVGAFKIGDDTTYIEGRTKKKKKKANNADDEVKTKEKKQIDDMLKDALKFENKK